MRLICSTQFLALDAPLVALAKTAWAGFQHAELAIHDLSALVPDPFDMETLLEAESLTLAGIAVPALAASGEDASLQAAAAIGRAIAWAADLGATTVRMPAPPETTARGEWLRAMERLLAALGERPGAGAVRLCLEVGSATLLPDEMSAHEAVAALGAERAGLALDLGGTLERGLSPVSLAEWPAPPALVTLSLAEAWSEDELTAWLGALTAAGAGALVLTHPGGEAWELESRAKEACAWLESCLR